MINNETKVNIIGLARAYENQYKNQLQYADHIQILNLHDDTVNLVTKTSKDEFANKLIEVFEAIEGTNTNLIRISVISGNKVEKLTEITIS